MGLERGLERTVERRSSSAVCLKCFTKYGFQFTSQFLQIVFRETAAESLLLGKVVGVVQGGQICHSFFRFWSSIETAARFLVRSAPKLAEPVKLETLGLY